MALLKRNLPLVAIASVLALAMAFGLPDLLSWDALAERQAGLLAWAQEEPVGSALCYVAVYAAWVTLSLPFTAVLTVAGGMLFGSLAGTLLAVPGAVAGAVAIFLAARGALAPLLERRAAPWLGRLRPGLERDGFSYLLALRLVPALPFWLVNLAAALIGMRLAPYAAATLLGILPGTAVYASIGSGLAGVLAGGGRPDLSVVLTPPVLAPLLGLAALALLPVAWRTWTRRHG